MKPWTQPPDLHYSFKSHFSWPNAAPMAEAAGAAEAAAAAGGAHPPPPPSGHRGFHTHGHGYARSPYHHWRPRFGLFRRAVWFGLGVAAASWYIHHKQEKEMAIASHSWSYGHRHPQVDDHKLQQSRPQVPSPAPDPIIPVATTPPPIVNESPKWGWGAHHERKRQRKEEAAAKKKEAQEIKEAVERAWAEQKKKAVEVQAQASDKAKEYARDKLDTLSRAVEKLREALDEDGPKDKKMV